MPSKTPRGGDSPEVARMRELIQRLGASNRTESKPLRSNVVSDSVAAMPLFAVWDGAHPTSGSTVLVHLANSIDAVEDLDAISISRWVAKRLGASPRRFVSRAHFDEVLENATVESLRERIASAQSRRERSAAQMAQRLREDGFDAPHIDDAINRACACGLIDDCRYAESFITSKMQVGWGKARIERELERAGVDPCDVLGYPEAFFDVDDEEERATELLMKKSIPSKNPVEKLARFLIARGFDTSLSLRLARKRVNAFSESDFE